MGKDCTKDSFSDRKKICTRCGNAFFCDVQDGCWCGKVKLSTEVLAKIQTDYVDCLCETCLRLFENDKK